MNPLTCPSPSEVEPGSTALLEAVSDKPALQVTPVAPVRFEKRQGYYFVDFGKAVWGNLELTFQRAPRADITVRLGEKTIAAGTIDREPFGSLMFRELVIRPEAGRTVYMPELPHQEMHEDSMAVESSAPIGEITPFRYAEIEMGDEPLDASQVRQLFVHAPFDDNAADFESSDVTLNAVWELCRHTMKATTAFGIYIDGERERIPYEADAYINQLSHFAFDLDPSVGRASIEHLLLHPTWPTEWSFHTIMMVVADFEATGDLGFLARHYAALHEKLLMDKARGDGLLRVGANIDWPQCERDGYNHGVIDPNDPNYQHPQLGPEINTVANAFYYHGLQCMSFLAGALGKTKEEEFYRGKAVEVFDAFNRTFFDAARGLYVDGVSPEGEPANHVSLHANMFALVFDLVPADRREAIADYIESRGMACSVYAAQYLLEALFRSGRDKAALRLMTARGERSWWNMIERGSTMTWEAWDEKVKPNLTWNHAWGASPANIVSRFVLGVRPLSPGYTSTIIAPQPGALKWAHGEVPTALGSLKVDFREDNGFSLDITIPEGMTAQVKWPYEGECYLRDGRKAVPVKRDRQGILCMSFGSGHHFLTAKP